MALAEEENNLVSAAAAEKNNNESSRVWSREAGAAAAAPMAPINEGGGRRLLPLLPGGNLPAEEYLSRGGPSTHKNQGGLPRSVAVSDMVAATTTASGHPTTTVAREPAMRDTMTEALPGPGLFLRERRGGRGRGPHRKAEAVAADFAAQLHGVDKYPLDLARLCRFALFLTENGLLREAYEVRAAAVARVVRAG